MAPPILRLSDIQLTFGGTPLLEGANMSVAPGERLCLVGRNGSGKSTFLKIAAGLVEPDDGEVFVQPGTTVAYLPQEPDLSGYKTALDYVESGLSPQAELHTAQTLLNELGLSGDEDPASMSGGERRRAAIVRELASEPDILLLDEPTNHLDLPAIEWLERRLKSRRGAYVLISHDRRFLGTLSNAVVWIDLGRTLRMDKGFEHYDGWREEIVTQETTNRHKLDRKLVKETAWLRKGVTARRKRNMGRLRALMDLRQQRREQRQRSGDVTITTNEAESSGKRVIEAKEISKAYDGREIVKPFSTRILRGDRVGIIGPNGAGKTTLVRMLTGTLAPDEGNIKIGTSVEMASLDQGRVELSETMTLQDALTDGSGDSVIVGGVQKHVVGYMKDFLFDASQAKTPVSRLSGGERGRLMLARAMTRPGNLLILDEPTNDLDLETLDLLQEMVSDYAGTVILVSHDRDFLDRIVTSVINYEGDGVWQEYAGGYADMIAQRGAGMVAAAKEINGDAPKKKSSGKSSTSMPSSKLKLSYKDKYALETLPDTMATLEREIAELETKMSDPNLFTQDPEAFQVATEMLTDKAIALSHAEEEWLRIEVLREKIEAQS